MANIKIGKFLKELRKKKNLTQDDVADFLSFKGINIDSNLVSRWENDKAIPDIEKLQIIAELFEVTIDEIMDCELIDRINYEDKYFIVNNNWFQKYPVDELYVLRQKQIILVRETFNKLVTKRIKRNFTINEDNEFRFLVTNFYEFKLRFEDELMMAGHFSYEEITQYIWCVLLENKNKKADEKYWLIKRLFVPANENRLSYQEFCDFVLEENKILKTKFSLLDPWEKDYYLSLINDNDFIIRNPEDFGSDAVKRFEEQYGFEFNRDDLIKKTIKFFILNGASINSNFNDVKFVYKEKQRIIERIEEIYEKIKKPLISQMYLDGEFVKLEAENNSHNRFIFKYYYRLKDLFGCDGNELISLVKNNDELNDELYIMIGKNLGLNINKDIKDLKIDVLAHSKYAVEGFYEYKKMEKEYNQLQEEYNSLINLLNDGERYYLKIHEQMKIRNYFGDRLEYCFYQMQGCTFKEFISSRNTLLTNQLINNLDDLTVKEIRNLYFKEVVVYATK